MKRILFIKEFFDLDYQCDCLFHGLSSLSDVHVEIINDYWFMFKNKDNAEKLKNMYGFGFTIANRIPIEKKHQISKDEAVNKIKEHYYDYVVYGSINRDRNFLDDVKKYYGRDEVAFIDGEDDTYVPNFSFHSLRHFNTSRWRYKRFLENVELSKYGVYFKRELVKKSAKYFFPISFAIPKENIVDFVPQKEKEEAFIYPGKKETYIYKDEDSYYKGYQIAKFGVTFKKAGWDCMRHYEILANGCIPYFPDINDCPEYTMVNFPKEIIKKTNFLRDKGMLGDRNYYFYAELLLNWTKVFCTTEVLAKYVLSKLK